MKKEPETYIKREIKSNVPIEKWQAVFVDDKLTSDINDPYYFTEQIISLATVSFKCVDVKTDEVTYEFDKVMGIFPGNELEFVEDYSNFVTYKYEFRQITDKDKVDMIALIKNIRKMREEEEEPKPKKKPSKKKKVTKNESK